MVADHAQFQLFPVLHNANPDAHLVYKPADSITLFQATPYVAQ